MKTKVIDKIKVDDLEFSYDAMHFYLVCPMSNRKYHRKLRMNTRDYTIGEINKNIKNLKDPEAYLKDTDEEGYVKGAFIMLPFNPYPYSLDYDKQWGKQLVISAEEFGAKGTMIKMKNGEHEEVYGCGVYSVEDSDLDKLAKFFGKLVTFLNNKPDGRRK